MHCVHLFRVLSKLKQMAKIVDPPKSSKKSKLKRKKIFQQTEYQGLACSSPGNSTRVKLLPEEENPYSEISGKESCLVGDEGRVPGASCNGYVDMKSMMPDNEHCSSFKIGKKSYSPQRHPIYIWNKEKLSKPNRMFSFVCSIRQRNQTLWFTHNNAMIWTGVCNGSDIHGLFDHDK